MAAFTYRRPRPQTTRGRAKTATRLRPPPSGELINAVIEDADLRDEMGGGRVMLRVSPARLAAPSGRRALGADAARLGEMGGIWDEGDTCRCRVRNGAPPPLAVVEHADPQEDVRFE